MKRCVIYARVSTNNGQQDPEMQIRELREYAKHRELQIVEEYTDNGVSGSKESRPSLNRLMADAQQRKFDVLLVWKLDRFARSLKHLVNALAQFEALGVAFAMAEFERELIRERVKAGLKNAKTKGTKLGRPTLIDLSKASRVTRWRRKRRGGQSDCRLGTQFT